MQHPPPAARAFLIDTSEDAAPRGPRVRLANFGFAVVGSDDPNDVAAAGALARAARADCAALGLALAELFFQSLSLEGPGPRTEAAALRRLLYDVFARDWTALIAFCDAEPAWAPAVALLSAGRDAGWRLLAALLDDDTYSADARTVTAPAGALMRMALEPDGAGWRP